MPRSLHAAIVQRDAAMVEPDHDPHTAKDWAARDSLRAREAVTPTLAGSSVESSGS
jgi:hypothetical protein